MTGPAWHRIFACIALAWALLILPGYAASAQEALATARSAASGAIDEAKTELGETVDALSSDALEFLDAANQILKKFGAFIAIIVVVMLGVLLRLVANLALVIIIALLVLAGRRNWALDLRALVEGLISLGIVIGCAFAWMVGTRDGLVAGISAGIDAQIMTWLVIPVAAVALRLVFPRCVELFAEVRELAA